MEITILGCTVTSPKQIIYEVKLSSPLYSTVREITCYYKLKDDKFILAKHSPINLDIDLAGRIEHEIRKRINIDIIKGSI